MSSAEDLSNNWYNTGKTIQQSLHTYYNWKFPESDNFVLEYSDISNNRSYFKYNNSDEYSSDLTNLLYYDNSNNIYQDMCGNIMTSDYYLHYNKNNINNYSTYYDTSNIVCDPSGNIQYTLQDSNTIIKYNNNIDFYKNHDFKDICNNIFLKDSAIWLPENNRNIFDSLNLITDSSIAYINIENNILISASNDIYYVKNGSKQVIEENNFHPNTLPNLYSTITYVSNLAPTYNYSNYFTTSGNFTPPLYSESILNSNSLNCISFNSHMPAYNDSNNLHIEFTDTHQLYSLFYVCKYPYIFPSESGDHTQSNGPYPRGNGDINNDRNIISFGISEGEYIILNGYFTSTQRSILSLAKNYSSHPWMISYIDIQDSETTINSNEYHLYNINFTTTGNYTFYLNNSSLTNSTQNTLNSPIDINHLDIGRCFLANRVGNSRGEVGEILLYNSELTDSSRNSISKYLLNKWNIVNDNTASTYLDLDCRNNLLVWLDANAVFGFSNNPIINTVDISYIDIFKHNKGWFLYSRKDTSDNYREIILRETNGDYISIYQNLITNNISYTMYYNDGRIQTIPLNTGVDISNILIDGSGIFNFEITDLSYNIYNYNLHYSDIYSKIVSGNIYETYIYTITESYGNIYYNYLRTHSDFSGIVVDRLLWNTDMTNIDNSNNYIWNLHYNGHPLHVKIFNKETNINFQYLYIFDISINTYNQITNANNDNERKNIAKNYYGFGNEYTDYSINTSSDNYSILLTYENKLNINIDYTRNANTSDISYANIVFEDIRDINVSVNDISFETFIRLGNWGKNKDNEKYNWDISYPYYIKVSDINPNITDISNILEFTDNKEEASKFIISMNV